MSYLFQYTVYLIVILVVFRSITVRFLSEEVYIICTGRNFYDNLATKWK